MDRPVLLQAGKKVSATEQKEVPRTIRKISVKKLFGVFDHEIPMNLQERITIIHGPNGFGKTVLLRFINAIFHGNYGVLRRIPYDTFRIDFDDGAFLSIKQTREQAKDGTSQTTLVFETNDKSSTKVTYPLSAPSYAVDSQLLLDTIEHTIHYLERVGPDSWRDMRTMELLENEEVIEKYASQLPILVGRRASIPDWLDHLTKSVSVRFIEAQRLILPTTYPPRPRRGTSTQAVAQYASELAQLIQNKLGEYGSLSQSLDRTFPTRLMKNGSFASGFSEEDLSVKLKSLDEKRTRLTDAGLLPKEEAGAFGVSQIPTKVDDRTRGVLSVYVQDVEEKLSVFDDILAKIEFLKNVINERFPYKSVLITRDNGYTFVARDGTPLRPADLSSGEQHQLILLHELLFKASANTLILVDEPELSLHIAWQERFLSDLQQIVRLSHIHALLATHSPQIISDRWDLTVELKGPAL